METITRKSLLYKSGIGVYCVNIAQGCSHGCRYPCYAYMMAQSYNQIRNYEEWCEPKLVINAAELLEKKLSRIKVKPETIHLSLSTDPFMNGYPEIIEMSLKIIAIINSYDIRCSILTKGKLPKELSDIKRYSEKNIYGISLVSLDEDFRKRWEPGTVSYAERIESLNHLHCLGLKTLAHIEPYPVPNIFVQDIDEILSKIDFVNHIYFGGWNYNNQVKQSGDHKQFYKEQEIKVKRFCNMREIYYNC